MKDVIKKAMLLGIGVTALTKEKANSVVKELQKKGYLDSNNENICNVLIKAAYRSVANIVVIPLQDILNLGSDARMNFPGKLGGNWTWRYSDEQLSEEIKNWLNHLSNLYERLPIKKNNN